MVLRYFTDLEQADLAELKAHDHEGLPSRYSSTEWERMKQALFDVELSADEHFGTSYSGSDDIFEILRTSTKRNWQLLSTVMCTASFLLPAVEVIDRARAPTAHPRPLWVPGVVITDDDHQLGAGHVDAHDRVRHGHRLPQPAQPRVPVPVTTRDTTTVRH